MKSDPEFSKYKLRASALLDSNTRLDELLDTLFTLLDEELAGNSLKEAISIDLFDKTHSIDKLTSNPALKAAFLQLISAWPYFFYFLPRDKNTLSKFMALISKKVETQILGSDVYVVHFILDHETTKFLVQNSLSLVTTLNQECPDTFRQKLTQDLTENLPRPYSICLFKNVRLVHE